ncbi:MAG TPA: family 20 glycosylhydrolase [bacterium]|nr:family 20 glycosylhydrolase [bacterium]HQG44828.1 family 20 glycosylhydrolase [bacterium]HQI49902.1 family 20 glycosylhydrolase [bacterium]HQJ65807.1 family 20 glycosylhydrolase [bacterium]
MIPFSQRTFYPAGRLWFKAFLLVMILLPCMNYAAGEAALLPKPQKVILTTDRFYYAVSDPCLDPRVKWITADSIAGVTMNRKEAYRLIVRSDSVLVTAAGDEGFFRAAATMRQLVNRDQKGSNMAGCSITDWPAFRIRGFMHDCGRSFIPVEELKKEVEILSGFKINTFHWHLTEDIAWRLASDIYPGLTAEAVALRDKQGYYSREAVKDFIAFCKAHFVEVIPEIDMPGHSAAFTRATGQTMQSVEGKKIVRELLVEACRLFEGGYFHVGTDEAAISSPDFVSEMMQVVRDCGKEVIGWLPGAPMDQMAVRQLWADVSLPQNTPVIDSRYRYLNHTDYYADLFAIYNARLCDSPSGSDLLAGGICSVWNDRKPASVEDILLSNAFYPVMLAFAERSWLGGGEDIKSRGVRMGLPGDPAFERFKDFEWRMMAVRDKFLCDVPFPYLPQTGIIWKISGPYPNGGDLSFAAPFEKALTADPGSISSSQKDFRPAAGAAIYLRHTWGEKVPAFYSDPQPDRTAYAFTWIYSPVDQKAGLHFSTHNYGRSELDMAPPKGEWDYKQSRIWLNGEQLHPPVWDNRGIKPDHETPYANENFWSRPPVPVTLAKGWNSLVIKLPVGRFSSPETRLVKWMFTAMITTPDGKGQPAGIVYSPERLRPEDKTRIACIGNSVTYGVGVAGRDTSAYPAVLQGMLGDKYTVGNFGRSGATLLKKGFRPYYRTEESMAALSFRPDIAVIHLGLNDTDPRAWPDYRDEFISDYLWLIDTLRSVGTKEFYIAKLSPIFNGHKRFKAGTRDWYWQIQERIEEVARLSGATLIDFNAPLKNRPDLLPDNLHPDKRGAAMLAATVFSALTGHYGGLQLPQAWSDGMVLQHDRRTRLRGRADRGEKVQVYMAGKKYSAVASATGAWEVSLDPVQAGGPYKLFATTAKDTVIIKDILAGEVWLCSGQSNMEWPTGSAAGWEGIRESVSDENLRIINFRHKPLAWDVPWDSLALAQVNNLEYFEGGSWNAASAATVKDFSAVAYYFGRKLREELGVPVGLIEMAVGGSPAEAWIERKALELHPQLVDLLYDYRKSEFRDPWVSKVMTANLQRTDNPRQRHPFEPAYLFEAGLSRLAGFPIRGFIWYQGESNANFSELYQVMLPEMVKNWRASWADSTLPFYFAQLSSLNRPAWPEFRDVQRRLALRIPYSGLVVTTDVGHPTDVHPRDKKSVGDRFAFLALKEIYRRDSFARSPEPVKAARKGDKVIVSFRYAGKLKTSDGMPVREIEVSRSGEFFEPASATIHGDRILIASAGAVSVRYGWKPFSGGNLTGASGLPVPTFKLRVE